MVRYFHPYLATRDIDWDAALVEAVTKLSETDAATLETYATIVQQMLDTLGDPVTCLLRPETPVHETPAHETPAFQGHEHPTDQPSASRTDDGVLIVSANDYPQLLNWNSSWARFEKIAARLGEEGVRGVLFDLRSRVPLDIWLDGLFAFSGLNRALTCVPLRTPGERSRVHAGFAPQWGECSDGYHSAFYIKDGEHFTPTEGAFAGPVGFIFNANATLPPIALALQAAGQGVLVLEEEGLHNEGLYNEGLYNEGSGDKRAPNDAAVVETHTVELGDGLRARVRRGERINEDGSTGLHPDALVFAPDGATSGLIGGAKDEALEVALTLLRHPNRRPQSSRPPQPGVPARAAPPRDRGYDEMAFPSLPYRLLAHARVYSVMRFFFPYQELMDERWDEVAKRLLARFVSAQDEHGYAHALAALVKPLGDSHVVVSAPALRALVGVAAPPVRARMVEGRAVVTHLMDAATATGIHVGDIVLEVDGIPTAQVMARLGEVFTASTPQSLADTVVRHCLNGAEGSGVTLTLEDASGTVKTVALTRRSMYHQPQQNAPERAGLEVIRLLTNDIGYADLDRLLASDTDMMFERFRDTRAIVFDLRGYPRGTAWTIAPRLSTRQRVAAALIRTPLRAHPEDVSNQSWVQTLPPSNGWHYPGKTVLLIDERTLSQAEHTCLFFKAANDTALVGSASAGANGDVTDLVVPGGIRVTFTGKAILHPDGRQLQRLGLQPDIPVTPTIAGIRAGRDEVLDKALELLQGTRPTT